MQGSGEREDSKKQTHILDALHDLRDAAKHLLVSKSQNMNAESPEGLIALRVAHRTCLNGMLAAVEFDRQPNLGTVEVDDE